MMKWWNHRDSGQGDGAVPYRLVTQEELIQQSADTLIDETERYLKSITESKPVVPVMAGVPDEARTVIQNWNGSREHLAVTLAYEYRLNVATARLWVFTVLNAGQ